MKTLIITAHPSSLGHTHRIATVYKEEAEKQGNEVKVYDLYKTDRQLPFLSFEHPKDMQDDPDIPFFQDEVKWADELVFIHPIWWAGPPAILKNWFDSVFSAHYAYHYVNGKEIGLLSPRKAKIFATSGGHPWLHSLPISPFRFVMDRMIGKFCGLDPVATLVCGHMAFPNAEKKFEAFLKKVRATVSL